MPLGQPRTQSRPRRPGKPSAANSPSARVGLRKGASVNIACMTFRRTELLTHALLCVAGASFLMRGEFVGGIAALAVPVLAALFSGQR